MYRIKKSNIWHSTFYQFSSVLICHPWPSTNENTDFFFNTAKCCLFHWILEPVCCKKQQKMVCGVGDLWRTWRIPHWFWISLSYSQDQFGTIQNRQRALILQTINWSGTHSKPTLEKDWLMITLIRNMLYYLIPFWKPLRVFLSCWIIAFVNPGIGQLCFLLPFWAPLVFSRNRLMPPTIDLNRCLFGCIKSCIHYLMVIMAISVVYAVSNKGIKS